MVLIWAFGQVYPDFNHKFLADAEFTTAQNLRFFPVDELKYHGSENRGMTTINFFEAGMNTRLSCLNTGVCRKCTVKHFSIEVGYHGCRHDLFMAANLSAILSAIWNV